MLRAILGKDIAHYVKRHHKLLFAALALTALASIFVVIPAYLLKPFVDEGMKMGSEPVSWKIPWLVFDQGSWTSWRLTDKAIVENVSPNRLLIVLTCIAFLSVLLKSIAVYLSGLAATALSNRVVMSLRVDLYTKFVTLPLSFYHKRKAGELIARATADLTILQNLIANVLIGLVEHPLTALVFLCYLFVMNYKLTLLVFVIVPLIVGLVRLFGRKVQKHATRVQDATAEVTSAYQETLLCLKVIYGFFTSAYETERFRIQAYDLYRKIMKWSRWSLGLGPMMDSAVFLVLPAVLIAGKVLFDHTLGELMSMVYAFSRVYSPVKKLALVNNNLRTLQGATARVFEIMRTKPELAEMPEAQALGRHRESIEFRGVYFHYVPGTPVLSDVSFNVKAGEMVAFVGSTGSGKSTLLDLVSRFYDVTGGAILIDGVDVRDTTLESLRRQIGIVNQDVLLFHDTISRNICYGRPDADRDLIASAARAAHAHEFIVEQAKGYDTMVGDRGGSLSGGQKQRIAIARALITDPSILILDEAASALDTESEALVQRAIDRLHGEMTILVVAHRLSTVKKADRIFVLEHGKIVESGTREELLSTNGRFKRLYEMQFEN
jgi:ATP-binding cassette, subfamily B, bacterial MsbA